MHCIDLQDGRTALMLAAVFESQRPSSDSAVSMVKTLIDAKADLEAKDNVSLWILYIETLYCIVITCRAHATHA